MIRVKLSTNFPEWPLIRQTPERAGLWGECKFFINEEIGECDFWVVYDDVVRPETTRCPPGNTLLITGEPPSVKSYHPRFTAQFAQVLTCHRGLKHQNVTYQQQSLPWMIGCCFNHETGQWDKTYTKDYDELSALPPVPKTRLLSVLSSNKAFTPGHQRRLAFVEALKERFGDEIDVFGRGIRDVEDKWDAIAPYKYHVVIENGQFPDYWTEKLSDTLLAGSFPFYDGCPNIGDYFPQNALTNWNTADFAEALGIIERGIAENRFEASAAAREEASRLILHEYNLFPMLDQWVHALSPASPKQAITLYPHLRYSKTFLSRLKDQARQFKKKI